MFDKIIVVYFLFFVDEILIVFFFGIGMMSVNDGFFCVKVGMVVCKFFDFEIEVDFGRVGK